MCGPIISRAANWDFSGKTQNPRALRKIGEEGTKWYGHNQAFGHGKVRLGKRR